MADLQNLPDFPTVEEVAKLLHLKRSTAYQYVHQGFIPAIRLGRSIRVPKAGILEMAMKGDSTGERRKKR